eukprot:m.192946 g.192946  ORF g.192946 m.192946 type:complete len:81 (-) comp24962_c0_seq3:1383-1625(-)
MHVRLVSASHAHFRVRCTCGSGSEVKTGTGTDTACDTLTTDGHVQEDRRARRARAKSTHGDGAPLAHESDGGEDERRPGV